jgi:hypothetical protein
MPDQEAVEAWIRRDEAARGGDRRRDRERYMSERLAVAVRLSRMASKLESNVGGDSDVRTR